MSPSFSFTFDRPIWKTIVDRESKFLFLELRHAEQQAVAFAMVDLQLGRLLGKNVEIPEVSWAASLHSATPDYLLLQSFTDTHNPEAKMYHVIALDSHKLVWQSENFRVTDFANNYLLGFTTDEQNPKLQKVELPSGEMRVVKENEKINRTENKDTLQPFFYSEDQPYFTTVANFIESLELDRPVGSCEYLEYEGYVCIAYYVPDKVAASRGLANYLLILDRQGNVLLHQCLEKSVPQVGLGIFFIAQNQLIVVQHQRQLVSYALS